LPAETIYFELIKQLQVIENEHEWQEAIGLTLYDELQEFNLNKSVFHWELEFPEILNNGFDAAIGNPPYLDVPENDYIGVPLQSLKSTNLYAYIPERSFSMIKDNCYLSFITPMAIISSKRMVHIQEIFKKHTLYLMNIDSYSNPGVLFENVKTSINIFHLKKDYCNKIFTTSYRRFYGYERKQLFTNNNYYLLQDYKLILGYTIPKISSLIEEKILQIIFDNGVPLRDYVSSTKDGNLLYYRSAGNPYYRLAFDYPPVIEVNGSTVYSTSLKNIIFEKKYSQYILLTTFFTSLYYWFWTVYSDCYNFHPKDLFRFTLDLEHLSKFESEFKEIYLKIKSDLNSNGEDVVYNKRNGVTKYKLFRARKSKSAFDEADVFLGKKLGFSDDMIDFLINYDLKYRTDELCQENN